MRVQHTMENMFVFGDPDSEMATFYTNSSVDEVDKLKGTHTHRLFFGFCVP